MKFFGRLLSKGEGRTMSFSKRTCCLPLFILMFLVTGSSLLSAQTTIEIEDFVGRSAKQHRQRSSTEMHISPNPATTYANVSLNIGFEPQKIEIRNVAGELVFAKIIQDQRIFSVHLNPGRYSFQLIGLRQQAKQAPKQARLSKWLIIEE